MSPTINVTSCANENAQSKSARRAFCSACMRIGAKSAAKSPTGSQPTPGTSSQIQGVVARWDTWETFFPPITGDRKAREGEQGRECIRNRWAAKSPTTPKRAGAIADQGNPWESGGSRKADLGDFQPLKSDRGRRHSCLFHGHEFPRWHPPALKAPPALASRETFPPSKPDPEAAFRPGFRGTSRARVPRKTSIAPFHEGTRGVTRGITRVILRPK
jgi:hypothetical protein